MTSLKFSAEDLESNRIGQLSDAQIIRISRRRNRTLILGFVAMVVMALIATTFLFFGSQQTSPILSLVGMGVAVLNAVMLSVFLRHWLRLSADMRGAVMSLCGEPTFTVRMLNPRTAVYLVHVENQQDTAEFDVSREMFEALRRHKGSYCFYRAANTGTLLSAEPM
jgi:drug/metabolite transporter superfamily protein YnfA